MTSGNASFVFDACSSYSKACYYTKEVNKQFVRSGKERSKIMLSSSFTGLLSCLDAYLVACFIA